MASYITLVSTVLVYCLTVSASHASTDCASHEADIVLLTADQLREEMKCQLDEALAEAYQALYNNVTQYISLKHNDTMAALAEINGRIPSIGEIREVYKFILQSELFYLIAPGYTSSHPAASCKEILELAPDSPSGLYWIRGIHGEAKRMYCDMERICNGVGGGWMRVASINMTDPSSTCPSGLRTISEDNRRLCAMDIDGAGCSSAVLPVEGVQYSRVCGKIIGCQQKSPDAFFRFISGQTTIDSNYVDGISLTHGSSPREHIWTFAAALQEDISNPAYHKFLCPCANVNNPGPTAPPSFVGQDYFCDTGSKDFFQFIFYGDDCLWDGAGCGASNTCCALNTPPWFLKQLSPTSDDIEMRLCADQPRYDEDITFETLELYVQ